MRYIVCLKTRAIVMAGLVSLSPHVMAQESSPLTPDLGTLSNFDTLISPGQVKRPDSFLRTGLVSLKAKLTERSPFLTQGVRWSINRAVPDKKGKFGMLQRIDNSVETVQLPVGSYIITASYGNAYLSKKLEVKASSDPVSPEFVLHAGGLVVSLEQTGKGALQDPNVKINLYSVERDQNGQRKLIIENLQSGQVIRLNAGLYHLVSQYGPYNATESADLTIQAAQLTMATLLHSAGQVLVKLVNRPGGEALPGTQWEIKLPDGQSIGKTVGAIPSFVLKAGDYHVIAKNGDKIYRRRFALPTGVTAELEIDTSEKGAAESDVLPAQKPETSNQ